MSLLTTKRVIRSGTQNFFRNGVISFSSVVIMTITLFIICSTMILGGFLKYSLDQVKAKVDINVYFVTTAKEDDILAIQKALEARPDVLSVTYISKEQALADFQAKHQGDQLTLQAIDELGYNPLGATLNIRAKDPSDYAGIASYLEGNSTGLLSSDGSKIIDKVNYSQNKVIIIFILISIIIVFNTIRLAIFMAKDEISVMRLVGASNKYVKGPFVISGILCGVISALMVLIFFAIFTFWVSSYYGDSFVGFDIFQYYMTNFFQFLLFVLGSGILLGAIASYFAVHKYLRN